MRFNYITITTMVVFGVEVIINTLGKQGYLFGFFFFLDVLSTVTLVLDLTYAAERRLSSACVSQRPTFIRPRV